MEYIVFINTKYTLLKAVFYCNTFIMAKLVLYCSVKMLSKILWRSEYDPAYRAHM
jgi:hypothetical protein